MQTKTQKNNCGIHQITDKSHCYPEPSSPPIDESPNTFTSNPFVNKTNFDTIPRRVINTQPHMFGQPSFPKYIEPYMPNVFWTPIQLPPVISQSPMLPQTAMMPQSMMQQNTYPPASMYMPNTSEIRKNNSNRNVEGIRNSEPDRVLFVQSSNMTMSKRFTNYTKRSKQPETVSLNKFFHSTPNKSADWTSHQLFDSFGNLNIQQPKESSKLVREPIFKRARIQSESRGYAPKTITKSNSLESLNNSESAFQKSPHKDDYSIDRHIQTLKESICGDKNCVDIDKDQLTEDSMKGKDEKQTEELDKNDLRYILVAKRRKPNRYESNVADGGEKSKGKLINK